MEISNLTDFKLKVKSLFKYMVKNKYTVKPCPKIVLDDSDVEPYFGQTAYYDPTNESIRIFIKGRREKDILRSLAHELIHHRQRHDGTIDKSGYSGTNITEDKGLRRLESEAYLYGNWAFRSWTEEEQKKKNK